MHPRAFLVTFFAIVLSSTLARSEAQTPPLAVAAVPSQASSLSPPSIQHRPKTSPAMQPAAAAQPLAEPAAPASRPGRLLTDVKLADLGFINGVRLSNLGGHRELFVPLPQDGDVAATDLVLAVDDISAFRRDAISKCRSTTAPWPQSRSTVKAATAPCVFRWEEYGPRTVTSRFRFFIQALQRSIAASICASSEIL